MFRLTPFSRIRSQGALGKLESKCASFAFLEARLSFARQTCKPRNELIDCSVEIFVHRVSLDIVSRHSKARAHGKKPMGAGFFANHDLRTQNVAGKAREPRDFLFDELSQRQGEFDTVGGDVDR